VYEMWREYASRPRRPRPSADANGGSRDAFRAHRDVQRRRNNPMYTGTGDVLPERVGYVGCDPRLREQHRIAPTVHDAITAAEEQVSANGYMDVATVKIELRDQDLRASLKKSLPTIEGSLHLSKGATSVVHKLRIALNDEKNGETVKELLKKTFQMLLAESNDELEEKRVKRIQAKRKRVLAKLAAEQAAPPSARTTLMEVKAKAASTSPKKAMDAIADEEKDEPRPKPLIGLTYRILCEVGMMHLFPTASEFDLLEMWTTVDPKNTGLVTLEQLHQNLGVIRAPSPTPGPGHYAPIMQAKPTGLYSTTPAAFDRPGTLLIPHAPLARPVAVRASPIRTVSRAPPVPLSSTGFTRIAGPFG